MDAVALALVVGALLLGAMSPGPSFVFTVRSSLMQRRAGLAAALGMGTGGAIFAGLAVAGLITVLQQVPTLYRVLRVGGALYLMLLAVQLWRSARAPLEITATGAPRADRSFALALMTQLSNPKTALVYASVFATFSPADSPSAFAWTLVALVFLLETGWYTLVAIAFSAERPRRVYIRSKTWIDRAASAAFGALGAKLVLDVARPAD